MATAEFPPAIAGGGTVSAHMLALGLREAGHEVLVYKVGDVTESGSYDGIPVRQLRSLNIYWNFREPRPLWKKAVWHAVENFNPRAFWVMRRELAHWKPDVVLTYSIENVNVGTWAAARTLGIPVCHVAVSSFVMCWRGTMRRGETNCARQCRDCWLTSLGKRWASRLVNGLVAESRFVIERHLSHGYFARAPWRVIPAAIDRVRPHPPRRPVGGRPVRFGFLGIHIPFKGLDTLAAAARGLPEDCRAEFVVAGSGPGAFAASLPGRFPEGRATFVGWQRADEFLPEIDVLIVPSVGPESFGRVIVEAYSHGVPVLGSTAGGIPESIAPGINGFTFEAGSDRELADLIVRLSEQPQLVARLSEGAARSAEAYQREPLARKLAEFLRAIGAGPAVALPRRRAARQAATVATPGLLGPLQGAPAAGRGNSRRKPPAWRA